MICSETPSSNRQKLGEYEVSRSIKSHAVILDRNRLTTSYPVEMGPHKVGLCSFKAQLITEIMNFDENKRKKLKFYDRNETSPDRHDWLERLESCF